MRSRAGSLSSGGVISLTCDEIRAVRRLLLVSHRPIDQAGGPAARWRSFARHLPEHGWEVDVVSAGGAGEFASPGSAQARAKVMETAGRLADPVFRLAGLRPEALPLSTLWTPRGAARDPAQAWRRGLRRGPRNRAAVCRAASPRAGRRAMCPLVVELRDLWAGNPAFDRGGPILRRARVECREARRSRRRGDARGRGRPAAASPGRAHRGDPERLRARAPRPCAAETSGTTILHSGTLTKDRPLAPLLAVLKPPLRLVLHGYVAPEIQKEIADSGAEVELVAPSGWEDAVRRIADADVALVTQARRRGRRDRRRGEGLRVPRPGQAGALRSPTAGRPRRSSAARSRPALRASRRPSRRSRRRSTGSAAGTCLRPSPRRSSRPYERPRLAKPSPTSWPRSPNADRVCGTIGRFSGSWRPPALRGDSRPGRRRFAPTPCRPRAAGRASPSRLRRRAGRHLRDPLRRERRAGRSCPSRP